MPQAGEKAALDKDDQLIVNRSATLQRLRHKTSGGDTADVAESRAGQRPSVTSALIRCCSY